MVGHLVVVVAVAWRLRVERFSLPLGAFLLAAGVLRRRGSAYR
ncbi:hypothetical protein [Microbacterium sp.]